MDPTTLDLRIQNTKASIEKTKRTLERHEKQREKRSAALKAQGVDITQLSAERDRAARSKTDRAMLRDLLKLHPHWLILWQPQPAPPPAPTYSDIVEFTRSVSRHKAPTSQAEGSEKGGFHGE